MIVTVLESSLQSVEVVLLKPSCERGRDSTRMTVSNAAMSRKDSIVVMTVPELSSRLYRNSLRNVELVVLESSIENLEVTVLESSSE